jgi:tetratricopeptide (TPR) repeat protein
MKSLFIIFLIISNISAQTADIGPALQKAESGNLKAALNLLEELKLKYPGDPSLIFLDGVLTRNGEEALAKYSMIIDKYPSNPYADASLFRIYSYYYALGSYNKAYGYMEKLKSSYPASPYIKQAGTPFPDSEEKAAVRAEDLKSAPQTGSAEIEMKNKYTIQAGAFLNAENAWKLLERLKKVNHTVDISVKEIGGSTLNIVCMGKYSTEEGAKSDLSILEKQFNIKGRIVELPILK